jgi:hypothetical protein
MIRAFVLASPFIIGLIWSALSPLLVGYIGRRFTDTLYGQLKEAGFQKTSSGESWRAPVCAHPREPATQASTGTGSGAVVGTAELGCPLPLPLEPENLNSYVEWLIDAPQLLPTILLAVVSVFVAVADGRDVGLMYVICPVAVAIGIIATIVIIRKDPQTYSAVDRLWVYTPGPLVAIILNLVAALIVIIPALV